MSQVEQQTLTSTPDTQELSASASSEAQATSSDPIPQENENRRDDTGDEKPNSYTPEEEAAIREQVEKAFEARKQYITKVFISLS